MASTFHYSGNGYALSVGSLIEGVNYSYNEFSIVNPEGLDYGSIFELEDFQEDYGLITESIILPYQKVDYGNITDNITIIPFGKLSTLGSFADERIARVSVGGLVFLLFGRAFISVMPIHIGKGIIQVESIFTYSSTFSYVGKGNIFSISSTTEGYIYSPPETHALFSVSGGVFESFGKGLYTGSGSLFGFSSTTESVGLNPPESTELFRFSGAGVERNTESYVGSGSLFHIGSKVERKTYSYNGSSVVTLESLDYGFINEIHTSQEDYGLITEPIILPSQKDDYGFIIDNQTRRPYGTLRLVSGTTEKNTEDYVGSGTISVGNSAKVFVLPIHIGGGSVIFYGSAVEKNTEDYVGTGSLFGFSSTAESTVVSESATELFRFSGNALESFGKGLYTGSGSLFGFSSTTESVGLNPPESTELFRFSGAGVERNTESYVGSGSLFHIGSKVERKTYSYNGSSVVTLESLDYGFINEIHTSQEDYGLITEPIILPSQKDDYGFIIDNQTRRPYGNIRFTSGTIEKNTEDYVGSGTISVENSANVFVLFSHIGKGSVIISDSSIEKNTEDYVGSGSLFGFSSTAESTVVSESATELFRFSGNALESFGKGLYTGSGSLFGFSSTTESVGLNPPESTELFRFSGAGVERNTESYVGSGSLFHIGSKVERKTYSYNGSSVVTLESLDYGFINEIHTSQEDYGLITEPIILPSQKDDYGFIIDNQTRRPYGSINISGSLESLIIRLNYFGSGSLFGFSSTSESTLVSEISSELFRFSGNAAESTTPAVEIGSGSLFGFVSSSESTVVSESSTELFRFSGTLGLKVILDYPGSGSLFGFSSTTESISVSEVSTELFRFSGSAAESTTPTTEIGSGSIFTFVSFTESTSVSEISSELFRFSGASVEKNTESYVGSGSIFAFSSTTESTTNTKPETTELFRFSGSAAESITPTTEIGSGSLFGFVSSSESTSVSEISTELFRFSGSAIEVANLTYIGSTQIDLTSTSLVRVQLKEIGSGQIKINGDVLDTFTKFELGSGSAFTFLNRVIFDSSGKIRYVSADESTTSIPPARTVTLSLSGEVGIYFQYIEFGGGRLSISGEAIAQPSARHFGSGKVIIDVNGKESTTPGPHIGSGSIFAFVSATESIGSNPPESTELFQISGSAVEKNTESYIGEIESNITGFSNIITTLTYVGNGEINIESSSTEKNTESYVGSGSIFAFISTTESIGSNPPESTELFQISGSAVEKNTESYIGSGSIFTFVSFTETSSIFESGTSLFRLSGTGLESISPAPHIGSGLLFQYGQRVIIDPLGKVKFVSADESTTSIPPLEINTLKISGSKEEQTTFTHLGTGSLFGFNSLTESTSVSEVSSELFRFSGSAIEKNTEDYVGSGSLFGFSSTAESTLVSEVSSELFRFSGNALESFGKGLYTGSGSLFGFVSSSESTLVSEVSSELFKLSGSAIVRKTEYFEGSGSIFTFVSSTFTKPVRYVGIQSLFKLFGSLEESFAKSNYDGLSHSYFVGASIDIQINFDPPKPSQLIII